jgi:hypothetical protein
LPGPPKATRNLRRQRLHFDGYSSVVRKRHLRAPKPIRRHGKTVGGNLTGMAVCFKRLKTRKWRPAMIQSEAEGA